MSQEEDLKIIYNALKKATNALEEKRQLLAQEQQEFESLRASAQDAVRQLSKLPLQITDNVTSVVRQATAQVAPAVARDLKGHLHGELQEPLASAKTHIANAAKVEQQLMGALKGFDQQVYLKLTVGVVVVALGALLVMFLALYWQRSSVIDLINQKAQLQAEMPQLQATADYLKKHGGKIQYTTCKDLDGAQHLCILTKTDHYYGSAASGYYTTPVGY